MAFGPLNTMDNAWTIVLLVKYMTIYLPKYSDFFHIFLRDILSTHVG